MMASVSANPLLKAARWYAKRNIFVFPLHNVEDDGSCSCRDAECKNQGKHPRTQHGFKDATIDLEKIGQWWTTFPKANIGIACEPTGWAVIDVDPRHGGDETLRDLEQQYGPLPDTVRQVTGSGGQHIVFTYPFGGAPTVAGIRPGIDTRARGGYIVGAPSAHVSGNTYAWEVAPGEMPLAELPHWFRDLLTTRTERQRTDEPGAVIPEGRRDETLASLAGSMRARGHTKEEIAAALLVTNRDRCVPPLDERDVRRIAWSISQYEAGKGAFVGNGESRHAEGLDGRVLLDNVLASPIPPPDWLIDGFLVRGFVHLLYGESGHGKTTVGLEFIRQLISRGEPVVFIDEESGHLKIAGLLQDMGVDSVDEHLHYFQMPGVRRDDIDKLFGYVDGVRPALVIFDSLTDQMSNFGLDDNKAVEVNEWFKAVPKTLTMRDYRPCVLLLDHVTKLKDNVSHSAGSRAKRQKSDVLWYLEKVEDFDRNTLGKVTLTLYKNNPGTMPGKHTLAVGSREGRLICEPFNAMEHGGRTLSEKHERFLSAINDAPRSNGELQAILECGHDTVVRLAQDLINLFLVERTGTGRLTKYQPFIRSDESNIRSDENLSSDFSSDGGGFKSPHRTKRQRSDERHWWEEKDQDEESPL